MKRRLPSVSVVIPSTRLVALMREGDRKRAENELAAVMAVESQRRRQCDELCEAAKAFCTSDAELPLLQWVFGLPYDVFFSLEMKDFEDDSDDDDDDSDDSDDFDDDDDASEAQDIADRARARHGELIEVALSAGSRATILWLLREDGTAFVLKVEPRRADSLYETASLAVIQEATALLPGKARKANFEHLCVVMAAPKWPREDVATWLIRERRVGECKDGRNVLTCVVGAIDDPTVVARLAFLAKEMKFKAPKVHNALRLAIRRTREPAYMSLALHEQIVRELVRMFDDDVVAATFKPLEMYAQRHGSTESYTALARCRPACVK